MKNEHVILKLSNIIETNNTATAKKAQTYFNDVWNSPSFLVELELAFNNLEPINYLNISRLEIDLGNLTETELSTSLQKNLLKKIVHALEKQQNNALPYGEMEPGLFDKSKNKNVKEHGFNEQEQRVQNHSSPTKNLSRATQISEVEYLKNAWKSFLFQESLGSFLMSDKTTELKLWEMTVTHFSQKGISSNVWFYQFLRQDKKLISAVAKAPFSFLKKVVLSDDFLKNELEKLFIKSEETWIIIENKKLYLPLFTKFKKRLWHLIVQEKKNRLKELEQLFQDFLTELKTSTSKTVKPFAKSSEEKVVDQNEKTQETIFIKNAGMVLLAPFLIRGFVQLKYVEENKVIEPLKAIQFLQYLESGSVAFTPQSVALYKILCGQSLGFKIEGENILTPEECKEADLLLQSVLIHWEALKSTSKEGLRQTFLQREGILEISGIDYKLRVEEKAFDVLLAKIPWSFGMIKLPWMTSVINVNW